MIAERKRKKMYAKKNLFTNISYCADCVKRMHLKKNSKWYVFGGYNKYCKTICSDYLIKKLIEFISTDLKLKFSIFTAKSVQLDI